MTTLARILALLLAVLASQLPAGAARAWAARRPSAEAPGCCCCKRSCPHCAHYEGRPHACRCGHAEDGPAPDLPWRAKAEKPGKPPFPSFGKACGAPSEAPGVVALSDPALPAGQAERDVPPPPRAHRAAAAVFRAPILADEILRVPRAPA